MLHFNRSDFYDVAIPIMFFFFFIVFLSFFVKWEKEGVLNF